MSHLVSPSTGFSTSVRRSHVPLRPAERLLPRSHDGNWRLELSIYKVRTVLTGAGTIIAMLFMLAHSFA